MPTTRKARMMLFSFILYIRGTTPCAPIQVNNRGRNRAKSHENLRGGASLVQPDSGSNECSSSYLALLYAISSRSALDNLDQTLSHRVTV